jgi:hypothetical protein
MGALGNYFMGGGGQLPGMQQPTYKKSAVMTASRDPNTFVNDVQRYRQQYGSLPIAVRAALNGGVVPTSSSSTSFVSGPSGSGSGGLPRTKPVAG